MDRAYQLTECRGPTRVYAAAILALVVFAQGVKLVARPLRVFPRFGAMVVDVWLWKRVLRDPAWFGDQCGVDHGGRVRAEEPKRPVGR